MKNVTIALDDDTHRKARIRAAELGTSLSALVKDYLNSMAAGSDPAAAGVREMQATFKHSEPATEGPWLIDGKWSYTRDGKPRQPGAMRGKFKKSVSEKDLETPEWLIEIMEHWDENDFDPLP